MPPIEAPGLATTANASGAAKSATGSAPDQRQHDTPKRQTATERLDHLDEIVAMVEARVLAELERRGGRHRAWM